MQLNIHDDSFESTLFLIRRWEISILRWIEVTNLRKNQN